MVIVVPAFAPYQVAEEKVVSAFIFGVVIFVSEQVSGTVDGAASVPKNRGREKIGRDDKERIDREENRRVSEIDFEIVAMEKNLERISQHVGHESHVHRMAHAEELNLPPFLEVWAVRVVLRIGGAMMLAMDRAPGDG